MMFFAVGYWNSDQYVVDIGVTDLTPELQGVALNAKQCGKITFYDQTLPYTMHCPTIGTTGRYVVLQSNSKVEHLFVLNEVMVYGYGKLPDIL